jgi:hypothetical protein
MTLAKFFFENEASEEASWLTRIEVSKLKYKKELVK